MKKILILLCSLSCAHATLSTVNWSADSLDDFRVDLTGLGFPISQELTSPSGLWDLFPADDAFYAGSLWIVSHGNRAILHGEQGDVNLTAMPYAVFGNFDFPGGASHFDELTRLRTGFTGDNPFIITSIPDLADNSTWSWSATYQAHRIPETGGFTCLAFGLGMLLLAGGAWPGRHGEVRHGLAGQAGRAAPARF